MLKEKFFNSSLRLLRNVFTGFRGIECRRNCYAMLLAVASRGTFLAVLKRQKGSWKKCYYYYNYFLKYINDRLVENVFYNVSEHNVCISLQKFFLDEFFLRFPYSNIQVYIFLYLTYFHIHIEEQHFEFELE